MRTILTRCLLALLLFPATFTALAQERVTIPKSRLEELERKEAELDRLRSGAAPQPAASPGPAAAAPSASFAPAAAAAPQAGTAVPAAPARPAIAVASLPPLQPGQKMSSADLVNHFLADPIAAGQRYRKKTLTVQGRLTRVSRSFMRREYELVLEGPQPGQEVVFQMRTPDQFDAVYTVNNGAELVGTSRGTRTPLGRVGDPMTLRGVCKGLQGAQVVLKGE